MVFSKPAEFDVLVKTLEDPRAKPIRLPLDFVKYITRNFSNELGRGGFGVVYQGVLPNGKKIAVKKLHDMCLDNIQFHNEIRYLMRLKHENIVRLRGYCEESWSEATEMSEQNYVMAEKRHMIICFEYLSNKSLDTYFAESSGLEWHTRFDIIKGISNGLRYLHKECRIVHSDLKPQNILMDDNMVPKIADFGMSRLFGEQSQIITRNCGGTFGYMAPEYLKKGLISTKLDIFSLGVIIIELLVGSRDYPESSEAAFGHFTENVVKKWRNRLEKTAKDITLEIYCQQVKACIEIAMNCVDPDPEKRPAVCDIIEMLNATESENMCSGVNGGQLVDNAGYCIANVKAEVPQQLMTPARKGLPEETGDLSDRVGRFSYGSATSPGKRASMEDFYDARIDCVDGEKVGMFSVYDGHGGVRAAEYVKQHLFSNLLKHPKFITDTGAAIAEIYNHTDSGFLKADSSQTRDAGSNMSAAVIIGDRLHVANVGDSRAVICKAGQAIAISRDPKILMRPGDQPVGVEAFYDKHLKKDVINPEIKELAVDSSLEFIILASRGLWDAVTNEEAVAMARTIQDPQEAASRLLQEASRRGSSGSITCVIVRFNKGR